jgi:hypothetical protein
LPKMRKYKKEHRHKNERRRLSMRFEIMGFALGILLHEIKI